ncbi:hypothetical protein [Senegalia massiliensis]|uniref:Uncharacterized protein n=1 Tax=Senegalia massiliensis TaxID=1720316 RepID=A0A845R004_9CLOT|nr:hypothetical protein [Senegalia massiliensis]NBI07534.1 hypothetical protein [Senegalia massiliensis]
MKISLRGLIVNIILFGILIFSAYYLLNDYSTKNKEIVENAHNEILNTIYESDDIKIINYKLYIEKKDEIIKKGQSNTNDFIDLLIPMKVKVE